jgi:hypothetical protein
MGTPLEELDLLALGVVWFPVLYVFSVLEKDK